MVDVPEDSPDIQLTIPEDTPDIQLTIPPPSAPVEDEDVPDIQLTIPGPGVVDRVRNSLRPETVDTLQTAEALSGLTGIDAARAYNLARSVDLGTDADARTTGESMKAAWRASLLETRGAYLMDQYRRGNAENQELLQEAQGLYSEAETLRQAEPPRRFMGRALVGGTDLISQMVETGKERARSILRGDRASMPLEAFRTVVNTIGEAADPLASLIVGEPEPPDPESVTALVNDAVKNILGTDDTGASAARATMSGRLEAGSWYYEQTQAGVPHELANPGSDHVGAVNSIFETAGDVAFGALFKGAGMVAKNILSGATERLVTAPSTMRTAARLFGKYAGGVVSELGTEELQEMESWWRGELVREAAREEYGLEIEQQEALVDTMWNLLQQAGPGFAVLGLLPVIGGIAQTMGEARFATPTTATEADAMTEPVSESQTIRQQIQDADDPAVVDGLAANVETRSQERADEVIKADTLTPETVAELQDLFSLQNEVEEKRALMSEETQTTPENPTDRTREVIRQWQGAHPDRAVDPEIVQDYLAQSYAEERAEVAGTIEDEDLQRRFRAGVATVSDVEEAFIAQEAQREQLETIPDPHITRQAETLTPEEIASEAPGEALKSARQEARLQTKSAVQAEGERQRGMQRSRRETQRARQYVRDLGAAISKPVPSTVDIVERQQIEAIQELVDPNLRQNRTVERLNKQKKYFSDHPELVAGLPKKRQRELVAKPLNEWTVGELETMAQNVRDLTRQGRLRRRLELARENRAAERDVQSVLGNLEDAREIRQPNEVQGRPKAKRTLKAARYAVLDPSRSLDKIDGGVEFEGPAHDLAFDRMNDHLDAEERFILNAVKKFKKKMGDLGISESAMYKVERYSNGKKYSRSGVWDIYAGWQNEKKRAYLQNEDMGITDEVAKEMFDTLTAEEKELIQHVVDAYNEQYPRFRGVWIKVFNTDPGKEDFYTPIQNADRNFETFEQQAQQEILDRQAAARGRMRTGAGEQRTGNARGKIKLGLIEAFMSHYKEVEHFTQTAELAQRLEKVFYDPRVVERIEATRGREANQWLQTYINIIKNPYIHKSVRQTEQVAPFLKSARRHAGMAYLAYRVLTVLKQIPSILFYGPEAGWALPSGAKDFLFHPADTWKFVRDNDAFIRSLTFDRFLEELRQADPTAYNRIVQKIGLAGMSMIWVVDGIVKTIGWKAVYNRYEKKLGHEGAVKKARNATLRTQPVGFAQHLPELLRSQNELLNWMTMFSTQRTQIFNMLTRDTFQALKHGKPVKAMSIAVATAVSAAWISMLSNRGLPEDIEELTEDMALEYVGYVPLVGSIAAQSIKGWDASVDYPMIEGIQSAVKSGQALASGSQRRMEKAAGDMLYALGVMAGLPANAIRDGIRGVGELSDGDIDEALNYFLLGGQPRD